jgi:hypothetical protein
MLDRCWIRTNELSVPAGSNARCLTTTSSDRELSSVGEAAAARKGSLVLGTDSGPRT